MHILLIMIIIISTLSLSTFSQEEPTQELPVSTAEDTQTTQKPQPESSSNATEDAQPEPNEELSGTTVEDAQPESNKELPTTTTEDAQPETKEELPTTNDDTQTEKNLKKESPETSPTTSENTPTEQPEENPIIPTTPEPIIEEALVIPEDNLESESSSGGIDTVSLDNPQGNWLFKRIWWERAEERYEKIRLLVDAIWESRNKFFLERNQLDRNVLDPFYMNIGIDRGELREILSEINDFLEKQENTQGERTEQERMLYETYITEKETLKQLKNDIDTIANLDHAIDDALETFMNQINRVRQFEMQAWNNFKEIAHILNDTRARELYYMIEGAARNIKTISTYLEQEFFTHFDKLINETKKRIEQVQNQMNALKEKGVKFQRQAEQLEQQAKQQQANEEEEEAEEEDLKPQKKQGWLQWISSGFSKAFAFIISIIRMPYDMIFKK